MKKIILGLFITFLLAFNVLPVFAQTNNDFEIIPQATNPGKVETSVENVGTKGGQVRDTYNKEATTMENDKKLGDQMASGIMTRNTLLNYVVYLVKFLSQIGLVIGAVMVIYAGYLYAMTIFGGGDASKGNKAILNAILGILIIAFSYAIMKLLTSAFIS
ncbi:MAG: hypothetical protein WC875_01125 [Candidatus Absconditabacterales bacterium]